MNSEEENSNDSEYDEESFDNESIEESSDDESIPEISNGGESMENLLQENSNKESLTGSVDKLSYKEEYNELSSLNSEEDDDAVLEVSDNKDSEIIENTLANVSPERNVHEIDESESDDLPEVDIVENMKYLNIQTDKSPPESQPTNHTEYVDDESAKNSYCSQSEIEFNVTSQTPTSFNSEDHAFHMDIIKKRTPSNTSMQQRSRNANRKSLSFSNERMREIERHNQILLRKILTQKPRKDKLSCPNMRVTSSAVNRKKQQRQIDLDNQVLKRKIEAISLRRPQNRYQ